MLVEQTCESILPVGSSAWARNKEAFQDAPLCNSELGNTSLVSIPTCFTVNHSNKLAYVLHKVTHTVVLMLNKASYTSSEHNVNMKPTCCVPASAVKAERLTRLCLFTVHYLDSTLSGILVKFIKIMHWFKSWLFPVTQLTATKSPITPFLHFNSMWSQQESPNKNTLCFPEVKRIVWIAIDKEWCSSPLEIGSHCYLY